MRMREGIRFVECNLAGVATIPALEMQDDACSVDECGMSKFAWVISMNMRLAAAIRAATVSVNKTDFNDHRTVGLIEGQ
ncbi:hypothetical protein [Megasphaera sp. UBA4233]|uniref:hypothetical protein n=1 Tax=Megasphaera sp. UBA4233 TaxID=1946847 RepID=UPI0025BC29D2|nr:hypothetical protein [Megasphaera sp. UBA4233]